MRLCRCCLEKGWHFRALPLTAAAPAQGCVSEGAPFTVSQITAVIFPGPIEALSACFFFCLRA